MSSRLGSALGVLIALALGSLVASLLYETSPRDPAVLIASVATLLVRDSCRVHDPRVARITR